MAYIDDIYTLLPDNGHGEITAADIRESFNIIYTNRGRLVEILENSKSSFRIQNDTYLTSDLGNHAIDLSFQETASTENGAKGDYSFITGLGTKTSVNHAVAFGRYNTGSPDNVFEIGVGIDDSFRRNSLEIKANGLISVPLAGIGDIENADSKVLVTKEYIEAKPSGQLVKKENQLEEKYGYVLSGRDSVNFGHRSVNLSLTGEATGEYSFAEGDDTKASGEASHAEGYSTKASGSASHAEGSYTTASGSNSHTEGYYTVASGYASHAEGKNTTASGGYGSHTEGSYTTASGDASHAECYGVMASGDYSHAEGSYTTASGYSSHAEGKYTVAPNEAMHAEGKYNIGIIPSSGNGNIGTIHETGIGTSGSARKNAFEIYTNGKIRAPELTTALIDNPRSLVTKEYADKFKQTFPDQENVYTTAGQTEILIQHDTEKPTKVFKNGSLIINTSYNSQIFDKIILDNPAADGDWFMIEKYPFIPVDGAYDLSTREYITYSTKETSLGISISHYGDFILQQNINSNVSYKMYTMATPWKVDSSSVTSSATLPHAADGASLSPDGKYLITSGNLSSKPMYSYELTTPGDLTTLSEISTLTLSYGSYMALISPNGRKLYTQDRNSYIIYQWELSTPWILNTATVVGSKSIGVPLSVPSITYDGSYIYGRYSANIIYKIHMNTQWDITTASVSSENVSFEFTGCGISTDGKKAIIAEYTNSEIHLTEYKLGI